MHESWVVGFDGRVMGDVDDDTYTSGSDCSDPG